MATLKILKLNALPGVLAANAMYLIKDGTDHFQIYVTDSTGAVAAKTYSDAKNVTFNRYDLPITDSTGPMDLAVSQVFKLDLSTSGLKTIAFSNPPARAMVIVIETIGSAGTIAFPGTVTIMDGVSPTLGIVKSIFTLFWDTQKYYLMSNGKVDA